MDIVLMIDISGSMNGHKISAVTDALENLTEALLDFSQNQEPVNIAVELFSREIRWYRDSLQPIELFTWEEPFCTGMTSMGAACISLADFIKKNNWSDTIKFVLLSDGCPTDDYEEGLCQLLDLNIFNDSGKYAIALGDEADVFSLSQFTGDPGNVFKVTQIDHLLDTLVNSIIPTSNIASNSSQTSSTEKKRASLEVDEWE